MDSEVWKDIPGYEGTYQVSSLGRVRSLDRLAEGKKHTALKGRVLRAAVNRRGYLHVTLRKNGRSVSREVHVLVASAFLGLRGKEDEQVRHLDGNQLNNKVSNLRYGTRSQNQLDTYDYRGYHHKLTVSDVKDIRRRLSLGETGRSIAKRYGVGESNISCIKHGGTYRWLT